MAKDGQMWLELLGTTEQFEKLVLDSINKQFSKAVEKSILSIQEGVKVLVYDGIYNCNEMESLRGDSLRSELGLTPAQGERASENIADAVSESVIAEQQKTGLVLYIQPASFQNVLSISGSSISYLSKTYKQNVTLEWLDWLINRGDEIIVGNFSFDPSGKGRAGSGRMKKGGSWRVSPRYAGTESDNFITRALQNDSLQEEMAVVIEKTIKKNWK